MFNKDEILQFVSLGRYVIYCFNETHVTANILDQELQNGDYQIMRCDSHSRFTGGVLMYIHETVKADIMCNLNIDNAIWILGIRYWDLKRQAHNLICVYRSPNTNPGLFFQKYQDIFSLFDLSLHIMFVGDLNINVKEKSYYCERLLNEMKEYGLNQVVKDYTRITARSKTLIDLVFTNDNRMKATVRDTPKISDHSLIEIQLTELNRRIPYIEHIPIYTRCFKNFDGIQFRRILTNLKWSHKHTNPDEVIAELYSNIDTALDI